MPLHNTSQTYGSLAKTFHWLTALLVITIIPVGLAANGLAHEIRDPSITSTTADITRAFFLFSLHKTLGVTIFFVALARISWAIFQPRPHLLNAHRRVESFAAETVHWLLYGSLVLVPLTGWIDHAATSGLAPIRWPFGQSLPFVPKDEALAATFAGLHRILVWVLVLALILHIAGAIKHHFVDRDATLRRMLPGPANIPTLRAQHRNIWPPVAALLVWAAAIVTGGVLGSIPQTSDAPVPQSEQARSNSDWQVMEGTLGLSITQQGNPVNGKFDTWTADIHFDETAGTGPVGKVSVVIAISSLSLGAVSAQAMGPDFFDADFFPQASFSGEIIRTETGYQATGPLVIRDTSLPVTLPFDLEMDGDNARITGALSLDRLDFGIAANMPDESSLGFAVDVAVELTAKRSR